MVPFAIASVVAAILCGVHAMRSGQDRIWFYILVVVPGLGSALYFLLVMLPDFMGTRSGQQAMASARRFLDPEKEVRDAFLAYDISPSIANRLRLARAYAAKGDHQSAIEHFLGSLTGVAKDDPKIMVELAQSQLAIGSPHAAIRTLEELRASNPGVKSPDGHLVYAMAQEAIGETDKALEEYAALESYYVGEEARARLAQLLERLGRSADAQEMWSRIERNCKVSPAYYRKSQKKWLAMAMEKLRSAA